MIPDKNEQLTVRMRRLAEEQPGHADRLVPLADKLDAASERFYSPEGTSDDVRRLLGCWARARRAWCDITGEPLI